MANGGKRPGAGRKPGVPVGPNKSTITANEEKAIARSVIREYVISRIPEIVTAQIDNALGIPYMVLRDKSGNYVEATDEKQFRAALAAGDAAFKVYTRQPHQGSASMLLAYAADKPVEPLEVTGEGGGPLVVKWKE